VEDVLPMASGTGTGSGIQFHCPAVSGPEVTTEPGTRMPPPAAPALCAHSAHLTGAVEAPDGHTHHQ